ncbi:MAG TPA: hypothetical protein VEU62_09320 [Bryobacterales bacterium]|nr:hypothetical protein [Bryobacterales bacterium]
MRKNWLAVFVLLGLAGALGLRAEIIDRIVAVVGAQAITGSEVEREARLEAFFNGQPPPAGLSGRSPEYRALLERVIEQRLIQREMEQTKFPPADDEQVKKRLQQLRPAAADPAKYSLREQDLIEYAGRIENTGRFLALRFPGTKQTADSELEAWLKDLRGSVGVRILEEEKP